MRHSYLFIIAIMLAVMTPRIAPAQSIAVKSNVFFMTLPALSTWEEK